MVLPLFSRPAIVTLVIGGLLAVYWCWSAWAGTYKLSDTEIAKAQESANTQGSIDLIVTLTFEPEQFHFLRLQDVGQVAGTEGRAVKLRGVTVANARALAENYWVEDVAPMVPQ